MLFLLSLCRYLNQTEYIITLICTTYTPHKFPDKPSNLRYVDTIYTPLTVAVMALSNINQIKIAAGLKEKRGSKSRREKEKEEKRRYSNCESNTKLKLEHQAN